MILSVVNDAGVKKPQGRDNPAVQQRLQRVYDDCAPSSCWCHEVGDSHWDVFAGGGGR